jgi:hypothetical protein
VSRRRVRVVLLAAIALIGCGTEKKDDSLERLAVLLAESIRSGDEAAFVNQHVQPGDMSPSGKYWLATKAGGTRPDEAWNEEVRQSFRALAEQLRADGATLDALLYKTIDSVTIGDVDGDADRRNLRNLTLRLGDGKSDWLITFAEGMNAQRGWVISGDLDVVVSREATQ